MRPGPKRDVLAGLAALACVLGSGEARASEASDPPLGVYLEVQDHPKASPAKPASPMAALLVLNAMPESRRDLLAQALGRLLAVTQGKRNPFYVAVDDAEERNAVEDLIAQTAPAFTAATTLTTGRWTSPDDDVLVRPVARCSSGRTCVRLGTGLGTGDDERRARFIAWPLGYAALLRAGSAAEAGAMAEVLRAAGSFEIGLVLSSGDLHVLRKSPAQARLQREARRLVKVMPKSEDGLLGALKSLARAGGGKDDLAWLKLPTTAVLVVPRLGSLAAPERFVADVQRSLAAANAKAEWLASPR